VHSRPPRRPWWILGLVLAVAAGAWYLAEQRRAAETRTQAVANGPRTWKVQNGPVVNTLRLTGVTAAEQFVSLVTPQLRASRSGRGRDGGSSSGSTQMASVASVGSLSSGRSGGSGGSRSGGSGGGSSSGGSTDAGAASSVASTASAVQGGGASGGGGGASAGGFAAPSGQSAFRSATSRISTPRASGGSRSSSRSSGGSVSAAAGADGLGSTGASLGQGMGGGGSSGGFGGGGSEFMLVLQDMVKPGSLVKKGDVVAEFDRQFMLQRLEDYKTSVAQQQANLKKLKTELDVYRESHKQTIATAKAALEKAQLDMRTVPVLSSIDAEKAKLALDEAQAQYKQLLSEVRFVEASAQAQIKNSELDLRAAELELRRAEQNADRMVSRATIDGMTVMQNTIRGSDFSQIQQGDQLYPGQFFMQIVDNSSMVINASLNQVDAERLRIGNKATVRFDAYPGLELPARVVAIAAVTKTGGFRASFVKEVPVRLKLDRIDPRVIPDLSVSADVEIAAEDAAVQVPLAAIQNDAGPDNAFVMVLEAGQWRRRKVQLGLRNNLVAVVRSGLKKDEVVALDPISDPLT
jgi:multidrug resistance efflux pump